MYKLGLIAKGAYYRSLAFRQSLQRLVTDRRGSAIAMMTAGLIPAIAALGASIDAGRMYIVKSQLQAGADAAALAGARAFAVTDGSANSRTQQVTAYFDGNFSRSPTYMGTTNVTVTPTFQTVTGINVTTVVAKATVRMSFMRIFGVGDQELTATAKAELQPRPLEVMLVLDNTGSMRFTLSGGKTRITALKEAARSFVDILHQGAASRRDLALGILPYDVTVNVGNLLVARKPNAVAAVQGINSGDVTSWGTWPTNRYAWKGCVMNDSTVAGVSDNRLISEPGAWDLTRTLPGDNGAPQVQPYYVPPVYVPLVTEGKTNAKNAGDNDTAATRADPTGKFYQVFTSEASNNLFRLDGQSSDGAIHLANSAAYRSYFYDYYIGLNNGSGTASDDVIRTTSGGYYDPTSGSRTSTNWKVEWTKLPFHSTWRAVATASVNKDGGIKDDVNAYTTPAPSPNWQCPEEAMLPEYGRAQTAYTSYIDNKNAAIFPGNGTIHHSGLLWGYRLLVHDEVFTRTNPTNEQPRRAIVFMTDGLNEVGEEMNGYKNRTFTWYGRWTDPVITDDPESSTKSETQMLNRFSKVCANIQREANAPEVYIIALEANSTAINTAFNNCAPGRVYRTSSTDELRRAFQDVAGELVDLHLIQ